MKDSGAFQIFADDYVTDDSGTGVVHSAPAFGEVRHHPIDLSLSLDIIPSITLLDSFPLNLPLPYRLTL